MDRNIVAGLGSAGGWGDADYALSASSLCVVRCGGIVKRVWSGPAVVFGVVALMGSASSPARACSPAETVSNQHFDHRAAPGGTWWGQYFDEGGTGVVHLTGLGGAADLDVAIVSMGPGGMAALAVPDDVVVGARYQNDAFQISAQWSDAALEVVNDDDSPPIVDEALPLPGLRVDVREAPRGLQRLRRPRPAVGSSSSHGSPMKHHHHSLVGIVVVAALADLKPRPATVLRTVT